MKRRFAVEVREGHAVLVDRDGAVLGTLSSITIDLDPEAATLGGATGGEENGEDGVGGRKDEGSGEKETSGEEPLIAKVRRVHAHFVEKCSPRRKALSPSAERLLRKAITEAGEAMCIQAIDGLVAYSARRGGKLNLSRVFQTRPNGSPLGEQIEWWAEQAEGATKGRAFNPSDVAADIQQAKRDVQQAAGFSGNVLLKAKADEAMEILRKHNINVSWHNVEVAPGVTALRPTFSEGEA